MISLKESIIVEGNYDKIKLKQFIDSNIIVTNGFQIYKNKELQIVIKRLAATNGVVILTDSDHAGFQIRHYLKNIIGNNNIKHAYIPDRKGKEKRKSVPSGEGLLGVEAMSETILLDSLKKAGCTVLKEGQSKKKRGNDFIEKKDFYFLGLSGTADSKKKREALLQSMQLPKNMPVNSLLDVLNTMFSKHEFFKIYSEKMNDWNETEIH